MIYLVRHGLDDENFIGGYSNVDLIDIGVMQIHDVGKWISQKKLDIRKIYSSDIKRALHSANIINQYLKLDIMVDVMLREQDKGLLNGMKKTDALKLYSEYMFMNDVSINYPNGESLLDLYNRVKDLLKNISIYDNSLIVTHRGVINMIYYLTLDDVLDMNKSRYDVCHGSVHEFDICKSKIRRIR